LAITLASAYACHGRVTCWPAKWAASSEIVIFWSAGVELTVA
jgi:hypothetical protein